MQRKAYVPGAAVLLAALLTACTSGSGSGGAAEDSKAGNSTASATAAQPGKYRSLSDACGAVNHSTLDSLLPGIRQITDEEQRDNAYQGEAALTYNNDRRSGCRWKAESTDATDHLFVDFERVVSYDNAVSDDDRAHEVYDSKQQAAGLPETGSASASGSGSPSGSASGSPSGSGSPSPSGGSSPHPGGPPSASASGSPSSSSSSSGSPSADDAEPDLRPRTLDDLGDEAFLDDQLSTSQQRTVTVVFRTSNVIVTIQYDEQPAAAGSAPSSEDMQDKARKLARQLAGSLG
ncbi:DUF3558 domain-containing protein [Streptomyces gibsoniae]|uniref:DUF3558 domain-containing protein n=1 Tax=Streptomyces gibsoniae TaxID=3075529 RepID=A0ABU2TYK1_9ACTN|nr:DUF3558 domain-containing protein [Streptomyces sp. DSM 41699]MDT0466016.1 DUF3558 domain-containing protein [Streptomyces sp. DSM 41699]